jgi:exonuclease III
MKIISWNVAHRVRKQKLQLSALISRKPDVIGLQEVTNKTLPLLVEGLQEEGYLHTISSFDLHDNNSELIGPRKYGILIASRWPMTPINQSSLKIKWPERLVSVLIHFPKMKFEFHVAHIPCGASHGWLKIETFEGIYKFLARKNNKYPRILCGDFNSPQAETLTGEVITWGQKIRKDGQVKLIKRKKGGRGDVWDAGERNIILGLAEYDLHDMFRYLNGYESQEFSWLFRRKGKIISRRRFDHIFASKTLNLDTCCYIHSFREKLLSDHSAIEVTFKI